MTRIYATILQTSASTGRVSVVDPNLQNTAKPISYIPAEEQEKENPGHVTVAVRECFISCEDHVLLSADYSQLEMRVLSHLSKDPLLIQFLKSGGDIFRLIAGHW
jgi:DNA polymerase-1